MLFHNLGKLVNYLVTYAYWDRVDVLWNCWRPKLHLSQHQVVLSLTCATGVDSSLTCCIKLVPFISLSSNVIYFSLLPVLSFSSSFLTVYLYLYFTSLVLLSFPLFVSIISIPTLCLPYTFYRLTNPCSYSSS